MGFLEGILYMIWRGVAIGVIISAPMGPVGILCVQRTLEKGRRTGFFTGVGAAISDLFYCLVTGFGLSLIEDFLKANQDIIQIIGSIVMAVFGVYLFKSNPSRNLKKPEAASAPGKKDVIQGFLFTFSNPLIIFLIIGLFARFNFLLPEISFVQYVTGYLFIIIGALCWWWIVSYFVDKVRSHFNLRSMWLINKITGSIIMLFALVGMITAISGLATAKAAETNPVYLNSSRGFGRLGADSAAGTALKLANRGRDTLRQSIPVESAEFVLTFRASSPSGEKGKWGVELSDGCQSRQIWLKGTDNDDDPLYQSFVEVMVSDGGGEPEVRQIPVAKEPGDKWISYRISNSPKGMVVESGSRCYEPLLLLPESKWTTDSLVFMVAPGAELCLDYIALQGSGVGVSAAALTGRDFGNPDVRETYFSRSRNPLEGEWMLFDRSLEDTRLRLGGEYRIAIAKSDKGFSMIYLDGARKNSSGWKAGDPKGLLTATAHKNIYDVEWLDPSGTPIEGEIKAQFVAPDLLLLQFVDHESTLRLRKVH